MLNRSRIRLCASRRSRVTGAGGAPARGSAPWSSHGL
nr:MAG TPA: hypothetical protein [Caudoviricetes sp.]